MKHPFKNTISNCPNCIGRSAHPQTTECFLGSTCKELKLLFKQYEHPVCGVGAVKMSKANVDSAPQMQCNFLK